MDLHTIGGLREEAAAERRPLKQLVSLRPEDQLTTAIRKLFHNRCSMAPVLTGPSTGAPLYLGPRSAGHASSLQCPSAFTATVQLQHAFLSMSIRAYTRRRCSNAQRTTEAGGLNSMLVLEWGIVVRDWLPDRAETNEFLPEQPVLLRRCAASELDASGDTAAAFAKVARAERQRGLLAAAHCDHQRRPGCAHAPLPRIARFAAPARPGHWFLAHRHLVPRLRPCAPRAQRRPAGEQCPDIPCL